MLANVLVIFTIALRSVSAQPNTVFYVFSNHQPSPSNQCQVAKNCTLEALLSSNILSNTSNIEVVLHSGIHNINSTFNQVFYVNNVTTLTIKAANLNKQAIIMCRGKTGFVFTFCRNLTIHGINFERCSGHQVIIQKGKIVSNYFTLFIHHSFDVNISAV